MRTSRWSAGALCLSLLVPGHALAQSIEYGALEQIYQEPVTTSATGQPQRVSDVPSDMVIITADQIRRSGADNLPDVLRSVPGLDVRRYGFAAAGVAVRGYNDSFNPRLLVLVNGQQEYLDDYGRTQWYGLPVQLDEIRQIEVVKGPSTALFGFNAAAGVINIITYDPLYDSKNELTARAGTQDYGALSGLGTIHLGNWGGVRVSLGGFRADEFKDRGIEAVGGPAAVTPQNGTAALDARFRIAPGIEAWASGSLVSLRANEVASGGIEGPSFYRTNAGRAGVAGDTMIGYVTLDAYRNESRYSYVASTGLGNLTNELYVVRLSDTVRISNASTVRLGLEYRNSTATSSANFAGQVGYQVASANLTWALAITPSLSLTNSVRVDYFALNQAGPVLPWSGASTAEFNARTITQPSFNTGLVWHATQRDSFRLTASRGLQLPSLFDLGFQSKPLVQQGPPVSFLGSPLLQASAVSNVEFGYERSLPALQSILRVSVFGQRTDNLLAGPFEAPPSIGQSGIRLQAANVGYSLAAGGEAGLSGDAPAGPGRLRWNASYAFIRISDHETALTSLSSDFRDGTPTHVISTGAGYAFGRIEADIQTRWQSRYRDYTANGLSLALVPVTIPNFVEVQCRLGYRVSSRATVALSVEQLAYDSVVETLGPPVERRVFVTGTLTF